MPDFLTYEFLKDFQSAIIGVLGFFFGFGGVILTLRQNAKLAREQYAVDLAARRHVVRAGLLAELRMMSAMLERNSKQSLPDAGGQMVLPKLDRLVSHDLVKELGLLAYDEIDKALNALAIIDDLNRRFGLIGTPMPDGQFLLDRERVELAQKIMRNALRPIQEAIDLLSR
jgi:hypothetical protein